MSKTRLMIVMVATSVQFAVVADAMTNDGLTSFKIGVCALCVLMFIAILAENVVSDITASNENSAPSRKV